MKIRKLEILDKVAKSQLLPRQLIFETQDKVTTNLIGDTIEVYYNSNKVFSESVENHQHITDEKWKLKQILDAYIEFDSDELFLCGDLINIFGGALRDALRGDQINDIDLLCTSHSRKKLHSILERKGYKLYNEMYKLPLQHMYKSITVISEPKTYINGSGRIVQLIFPRVYDNANYRSVFESLVSNVDISCCGLSYDGINLFENVSGALEDIRDKTFRICPNHYMYSKDRIILREQKFLDRGYVNVSDLETRRKHRIESILSNVPMSRILNIDVIEVATPFLN